MIFRLNYPAIVKISWGLGAVLALFIFSSQANQAGEKLPPGAAEILPLADTLETRGDLGGAIDQLKKLEAILRPAQQTLTYVKCLNDLSRLLVLTEDYPEALRVSARALATARQSVSEGDTLMGNILSTRGEAYLNLSELDSAQAYHEQAAAIFEKNKTWRNLASVNTSLVVNYYYRGDPAQMEKLLDETLDIVETHLPEARDLFSTVFQLQAILYSENGDYTKAIQTTRKSLEFDLSSPRKDSSSIATGYNNLAAFYVILNDFDLAEEYLHKTISIEKQIGASGAEIAKTYLNLAINYVEKRELDKSLETLHLISKLLEPYPREQVAGDFVQMLNRLCMVYGIKGDYEKVIHYAEEMLRVPKVSTFDQMLAHRHKGSALNEMGRSREGIAELEQSLDLGQKKYGANSDRNINTMEAISKSYIALGDLQTGLSYLQKSLNIIAPDCPASDIYRNPNPDSLEEKNQMLLNLLSTKGDALLLSWQTQPENEASLANALETYRVLANVVDRVRQGYISEGSRQFLVSKSQGIYGKAISAALAMYERKEDPVFLEEAFSFSQKSKAILLLERLRDAEAKVFSNLPDTLLQQEDDLKRELSIYQKKLFEEKQKNGKADSLKMTVWEGKVFDLKRSLEKHNATVEKDYPEYFELKNTPHPPTVASVQQKLPDPDQLYIEYFTGDSVIYAFRIDKKGIAAFPLAKPADFEQLVMNFRTTLATPPEGSQQQVFQNFVQPAHRLYQLVLAKVLEGQPPAASLVIVPHGELSYIPFEVLLTENAESTTPSFGNLPYLLKKHRVNYSYAAGLLFNKRKDRKHRNDLRCLAFAPSYENNPKKSDAVSGRITRLRDGNIALPGAQKEVKSLSEHFPGDYFFGTEATEKAFKEHAGDYRLIHLAMHGSANPENPLYSKLAFTEVPDATEDNILHAYEIYNLRLNADLVVLSACETGYGRFVHGEGVMSLAQSFLQAGCHSLTMSLWEAQDEATAGIMSNFYKGLKDGLHKGEALRQAKLIYIEQTTALKHPFFWAGFVMIGENDPLMAGSMPWWAWLIGFSLFGLVGWVVYSRFFVKKGPEYL